jgi:hypothetical protein
LAAYFVKRKRKKEEAKLNKERKVTTFIITTVYSITVYGADDSARQKFELITLFPKEKRTDNF